MDFENQKMVEEFFNKNQTKRLIRHHMQGSETVVHLVSQSGLPEEFCYDFLAEMALRKRASPSVLVGLLVHHFGGEDLQACADALVRAAETGLALYETDDQRFVLRFDVGPEVHQLIKQYQYMPPMTVPPLEVRSNRGSGYLTIRKDSLILKDNHHEGDLCLDSINRFNQIPLTVNTALVKLIRNKWKNLDKPKEGESFEDYQKRLKAFERFERESFFTIALMAEMGNRFYFTHKYDKRGRTYCSGYHLTTQGTDWSKAIIELADPEYIQE